ncbi:MAG: hypothetical protein Q8N21_04900 [bacterium]|nr:hypothetical protein [bacterium]
MLSTWEAAVQSNLTASTTVVYSGTGTGALPAGSVLELFRAGVYQDITASTTATTTTQILVHNFSGVYKVLQDGDQWRVASSTDNMWTVSSAGLGDSAIAVAKIDGAWASADTTALTITGWTTSAENYIKVYTTTSARHNGKWDNTKYRLTKSNGSALTISEEFVRVEGLQIGVSGTYAVTANCIVLTPQGAGEIHISYNIAKASNSYVSFGSAGIAMPYNTGVGASVAKIWNNIIYDFNNHADNVCIDLYELDWSSVRAYNNTVHNCRTGIDSNQTDFVSKNNIAQNCTNGFNDSFSAGSDYNLSDLAGDAPGANSKNSTNVVFVDEANDDFHLSSSDVGAKDFGTDLSADANLPFTNDIDGQTRAGTWDIGADEAAEEIYRSVGPSKTTALAVGTSNALTVSGSTATFITGLPDNVGVGDGLQYDDDGDSDIDANDSIVFIYSRVSSSTYAVKTASGAVPAAVSGDTDWSLFRAYTSLALAETGTENTGIDADLVNFDTWTLGKNISSSTGSNEQWNIACYANGTTADTAAVTITGWTTTADNYIKIYTPTASSEVGASQRHQGKWDEGMYRLESTNTNNTVGVLHISEGFVRIDGLQVQSTAASVVGKRAFYISGVVDSTADIRISNNIIRPNENTDGGAGIFVHLYSGVGVVKIWNNIVYDYDEGNAIYSIANAGTFISYIYNNTIHNSSGGILSNASGTLLAKNNITQNCADGFYGNFSAGSDYNISDKAGDTSGISPSYRSGLATNVVFTDETNDDFHLAPNDYSAINAGTNLSADSYLAFTDDIDGETRPISTGWDIGADESYLTKFKLNNGTFKIRGSVKFE